MTLRSVALHTIGGTAVLAWISLTADAQVRRDVPANSATHASAEITNGKLNPSETKPGDKIALRLKDDVRANGDVVLKKSSTITGIVRRVKNLDTNRKNSGEAQSMIEIEWFTPPVQGKVAKQVSIAVQSIVQLHRPNQQAQAKGMDNLGVSGWASATTRSPMLSNTALLNMPSVMAVDDQTASTLETSFGTSSSSKLFRVGRGELVSANGSKQSVDLFSHLSNDTIITSSTKDFEISSGAQMQLLVGVSKQ